MGRGFRIFFVAVVFASVGLMAWILLRPSEPEPVYKGKPLGIWLEAYVSPGGYQLRYPNGPTQPTRIEADEALQRMGTNAVTCLMRRLKERDSKTKVAIMKLLQRQHFIKVSYTPTIEFWNGFSGLAALGPAASNAVPQLVRMLERDPSPFTQQAVPVILGRIGPAAVAAVPALVRESAHTNWAARCDAAFSRSDGFARTQNNSSSPDKLPWRLQ